MDNNKPLGDYAWYLDITPNQMFSLYDYPIPGKGGVPLCALHGKQLEMKEVVVYDRKATEFPLLTIVGYVSEWSK